MAHQNQWRTPIGRLNWKAHGVVCFTCLSCSSAVSRCVGSSVNRSNSVMFLASIFVVSQLIHVFSIRNLYTKFKMISNTSSMLLRKIGSSFSTRPNTEWKKKLFTGRSAFVRLHTMTQAHKVSEIRLHASNVFSLAPFALSVETFAGMLATQRQCAKNRKCGDLRRSL